MRRSFDRRDESVASPGKSLDVARRLGIVSQRRPDLVDGEVQPLLKIHEGFVAPDLLLHLFPSYQLAGTGGEQDENFERLRWKVQQPPAFPHLTCFCIESQTPAPPPPSF